MARALLRNAAIVIMDEPSSNVDEASDHQLQKVLRATFALTTTLVIAHRLETIIDADAIITLDAGRLVEKGCPADLVSTSVLVASLYERSPTPTRGFAS